MSLPRAAVYLRVSTDQQNAGNQRAACLALCEARGFEPWIVEEVGSGVAARKGWESIEEAAEQGQIAAVVVWALDRMGRSLYGTTDAVRRFDARGIKVISVQEPWAEAVSDLARPLLLGIFDWIANWERRRMLERARAGVATARKRGKLGGRPRTLDGDDLTFAIEQRLAGLSYSEIRDAIIARGGPKVPRGTVQSAVKNAIEFEEARPAAQRVSPRRAALEELGRLRAEQKRDMDKARDLAPPELDRVLERVRVRAVAIKAKAEELAIRRAAAQRQRKAS